jgi:hypothetical protein
MSPILSDQFIVSVGEVYKEASEELEASSIGEFASAIFLGLGVLLTMSAITFLLFSGIVATLLKLAS